MSRHIASDASGRGDHQGSRLLASLLTVLTPNHLGQASPLQALSATRLLSLLSALGEGAAFQCPAAFEPAAAAEGSLKMARVSPYANPIWKFPPAATAMYCSPFTW